MADQRNALNSGIHTAFSAQLAPWPPVHVKRSVSVQDRVGMVQTGVLPVKRLGRSLSKMADAGIWALWQLKYFAKRLEGRSLVRMDMRKIILSEMLALAKEIQESNLADQGEKS
ncbi:MAG: hypothetical protein OXM02_05000 [Bacteroidota bacterium]|nr:hypothetical protein [Bacteroidota bacterium]MDE2833860.1 hypothetical protein [Bacteroidota bacterium]